jgi:aconitate hydratase
MMGAGAMVRSCFCGPCFGAGDTPANGELSIRHTTRNFPNREGSKPGEGQIAAVALMDSHSIAATAINGGKLTAATDLEVTYSHPKYFFDKSIYEKRVYDGTGKPDPSVELKLGPNIKDWPAMPALTNDILLKVVSYITDSVTTTDELIPSGETSSFRSNPLRLAEFTLSRKDPAYVGKAKEVLAYEVSREAGKPSPALEGVFAKIRAAGFAADPAKVGVGSAIYAVKPGDGSAREQAASCQKVLGGWANIAKEYATKRYRSNCINWGILPFLIKEEPPFEKGDYIFIPNARESVLSGNEDIKAYIVGDTLKEFCLSIGGLTQDEKQIIADGCLINFYRA